MTIIEKVYLQTQINELQKRLDKCDEVEPFTCKGEWYTGSLGVVVQMTEGDTDIEKSFNYWQSKEIAEQAYKLQLRHRKMLSFVSQHQELGLGTWNVYMKRNRLWNKGETTAIYPDIVMMTKETADLMIKAIENGSLDLS